MRQIRHFTNYELTAGDSTVITCDVEETNDYRTIVFVSQENQIELYFALAVDLKIFIDDLNLIYNDWVVLTPVDKPIRNE